MPDIIRIIMILLLKQQIVIMGFQSSPIWWVFKHDPTFYFIY